MTVETQRRMESTDLPRYVSGPRAVGWWGIVFLVVIEVTVFSSLISSYFYLAGNSPEWPQDGLEPSELLLPTLNTLLLLSSVIPMGWAVKSISKGNQFGLKAGIAISFVIGLLFLILKVIEYSDKSYTWATNAYGSIVWTMIGFHTVHVIATLLKMAAIWVLANQGYFRADRHVAVDGNAIYWYFVVGIWIPLYFTIYWAPRWL